MLVKLVDSSYMDTATQITFRINESRQNGWRVVIANSSNVIVDCLQDGYKTRAEAESALDDLMSTLGAEQIQPPVTEEETEGK